MPIPDSFKNLVPRLLEATNSRAINWSEGPGAFTHSASLPTFSIRIQSVRQSAAQNLVPAANFPITFTAIDSQGQPVDQFQVAQGDKDFPGMVQLYEAAYRSSRKIDDKVAAMLKEIELKMNPS